MSAINSLNAAFFMSGAEGSILIAICVFAGACTLAVIALAIIVALTIRRRKSENNGEVSEPAQEEQPSAVKAEQAEQAETAQPPEEALAEPPVKASAEMAEQTPAVTSAKKVRIARGAAFVSARYDKSFIAKLIQSDDGLKGWYSSLKNALLGYKKVTSRISWRTDSINRGRIKLAKFAIRGKTLRLYLALNPDDYADTKYKVERAENKRYEEVPCMYRIKNGRRAKYALELIATLAEKFELQPIEREQVDYYLPYEENEPLLERGLIKEIIYKADESVQVEEDGEVVEEVVNEVAATERVKTRAVLPFAGNAVQYNRSFTAKLIQSGDGVKSWYAALKNQLLSYKKVKSRISWKRESFRFGRKIVARFGYRGNTLCVYLPLNPADYEGTKYKVEDVSAYAAYADAPCMYRLKNERRVRYAAELITALAGIMEIERTERTAEDYYLPYEDDGALIEKGLIKVVRVTTRASETADEEPTGKVELSHGEESVEEAEEVAEEIAEEVAAAEVPEEEPTEENAIDETAEEKQTVEEETVAEATEEHSAEAVEEVSEPFVEDTEEISEEVAESEPTEEPAIEAEVEQPSAVEPDDEQSRGEEANDDDGIEVVGVTFRRRGKKVYWFDPDGKTWEIGEIAFYETPSVPPQEVIVVENAKISPSKLHLPLKPLRKAKRRPK